MYTRLVQLYSDDTSVNLVFVSDKIINNSDDFRIKGLIYSILSAILCVLYFLFIHFYLILENMSINVSNFPFPCYI